MKKLALPFPPTGNHSVKHGGGKHYLTADAKAYLAKVRSIVMCSAADNFIDNEIRVVCEVFPPDNRRRDLDNTWKTLADALTHANVWKDDSQIVDLRLVRGEVREGGMVTVEVTECV
jgi:crossover junction endodeoxyribonuclease RusA